MPTNRTAELQLRGRSGTLQGRVCWPGPSLARQPRLLVFWTVAGDGTWCQQLSASAGLVVLAVTCGRPCPADLDDAVTAAGWAAENTARLGADPGELLAGGAGPGGTLAAAVALHARAARWPAFSRQVLVCASPVEPMPPSLAGVDLNDFTARPGPALCSMAVSARSPIPPESDVSPGRSHLSSQTGDTGTYRPARAAAGTRAMKAAPVGIGDLEPHRRELTGYCQRIAGASEADDAVQETMLRAWRASAGFDGRSSVRAWLYRIAANTCLDLLRGRERRGRPGQRLQASAAVSAAPASPADPAELAATQDGVRLALAAMPGQLPTRQRAALILCEILRWRSDEAARVLGTSAAAVTSSLQRARATLARQPGPRNPGNIDADQLARYQDAFRRYDIATLVRIIRVEAGQAAG